MSAMYAIQVGIVLEANRDGIILFLAINLSLEKEMWLKS